MRLTFSLLVWLGVALTGSALAQEVVPEEPGAAVSDTVSIVEGASHPQVQAEPTPEPVVDTTSPMAPAQSNRPVQREDWDLPAMHWDDTAGGPGWSLAVMSALRGPGAPLMEVVPRDIDAWCPAYPQADRAQRAAFWAGLVSVLAWHESTHRPHAVGGGNRWFGLVQIAPGTARYRNCQVRSGQALLNGAANLRCGVRIMGITVPRDGVVSEGMRGVAADWGPFHSRRKREDMRNWVRNQSYCQLEMTSPRPLQRPEPAQPATEFQ